MTHHWDEFSKSLAEKSVPRRQSLRLLGAALAGALLGPLGVRTAWAAAADPCKAFCNQCPKSRRSNCLTACRACKNDPSSLCGDCSRYYCCENGRVCCNGYYCLDVASDVHNCGACGNGCWPGPFEESACLDGHCVYACAEGAVRCDEACTYVGSDPDNCGACGIVCPEATPACIAGVCSECPPGSTNCGGYCAFLAFDPDNCGACGFVCPGVGCSDGQCDFGSPPSEW